MVLILTGQYIESNHYQDDNGDWYVEAYDILNDFRVRGTRGEIKQGQGKPVFVKFMGEFEVL